MKLENNLNREDDERFDIPIGMTGGTIGAVTGYLGAGALTQATEFSGDIETGLAAGVIAAATILGYRTFNKISDFGKNLKRNSKRKIARNKTLKEMSHDDEFLKRQGIDGKFGPIRNQLNYALTVPAGGALGYFSGVVGVTPLCVYLGKNAFEIGNGDILEPVIDSGGIAGAMIGTYAFTKMVTQRQYEKLATTASTLTGIAATHIAIAGNISTRGILNSNSDINLHGYLVTCALAGAVAGIAGNLAYKGARKLNEFVRNDNINEGPVEL